MTEVAWDNVLMPAEVAVMSLGKLGISKEEKPLPALPTLLSRARDSEMWRSESPGGQRLAQLRQIRRSLKGKAGETGLLSGDTIPPQAKGKPAS